MFYVWVIAISVGYIKVSFVSTEGFNFICNPGFSFGKVINFFNRKAYIEYS